MKTRARAKKTRLEVDKTMAADLSTSESSDPLAIAGNSLNGQSYTNSIFGNNVIFGVIGDYLSISDLTCLRQTCSLLLAKVNGHRKFLPNLRVTVTDETIVKGILNKCTVEWKNVKIIGFKAGSLQTQTCRLPNSLQDLELEGPNHFKGSACRAACLKLLGSPIFANLESLTFDVDMLGHEMPMAFLAGVVGTVRNLRLAGCDKTMNEETDSEFRNNLNILGGLGWRLKSINILDEHYIPLARQTVKAFGAMLVTSTDTVETIKLGELQDGGVDQLQEVLCQHFPCLKNIKFTITPSTADAAAIARFFSLQSKLESIQFGLTGLNELFGNYPIILNAVKSNFSSKLHTFCLRGRSPLFQYFAETSSIRDLEGLKVFGIRDASMLYECSERWVTTILSNLPSTVRCLDISTLPSYERAAMTIGRALPRISLLSELKIRNNVLDENGLQIICRILTGLRVLQFGADKIHDFGITGEIRRRRPDSGVSLRNLRGLRKLEIYQCCKATPAGLAKAIQFLELKEAYLHEAHIPEDTLLEIASNNPSLEFVSCRYVVWKSRYSNVPEVGRIKDLISRAPEISPRLKEIKPYLLHECGRGCRPPLPQRSHFA